MARTGGQRRPRLTMRAADRFQVPVFAAVHAVLTLVAHRELIAGRAGIADGQLLLEGPTAAP
jgi:hypothetical protein